MSTKRFIAVYDALPIFVDSDEGIERRGVPALDETKWPNSKKNRGGVAAVVQNPKVTRKIEVKCLIQYISSSIMYKVVVFFDVSA